MDESSNAVPPQELGLGDTAQWRAVLRSPFRNLLYATFTTSLGDWVGLVAILALTEAILGPTRAAAFALSGVMIARVLPTMLLGPVAGVFADRWNRRRLLIATDIGRGVVMALIPFANDVWALFLATLVIETMATMFIPVKDAIVPNLVPEGHLVQANQMNLLAAYGTLPIGGFVYAAVVSLSVTLFGDWTFLARRPAAMAIWLNALTFFLSAWFVSRIEGIDHKPRGHHAAKSAPGAWEELKEGLRFIRSQSLVRALVLGVMGAFLAAGAVVAVGKLYATVVNAGEGGFGILAGLVGTGLFVGILSGGLVEKRFGKERMVAPGIGLAGAALIVTALMPRLDLAGLPAALMGFGGGVAFITGYTLLQEHTADVVRGRTFAAFNTGVRGALFAALVIAPFLVGLIGPETGIGASGTVDYSIGGVRITLMLAGAAAILGAVYSGRSIHRALTSETGLQLSVEPVGTAERLGLFIVFEGGEGAGKSTQVRLLRAAVERAGYDVLVTREPGGTLIGEQIRALLLDPATQSLSDRAEALLYAAARAQHVEEVIRPALEKGAVVLCDRFIDSSVVYQGVARGLGDTQVAELNRWGTGDLQPDLTIVLDVDAVEGLRRAGESPDRLENEGVAFHRTVNEGFRRRASAHPERYLLLDATAAVETVHARIRAEVLDRLGEDIDS